MKLKQVLEKTTWECISSKYETGKKRLITYEIDGKDVTKEKFEREQKRRCLFKKIETFSESPGIVIGSIESDGVPEYVGSTREVIIKYIQLF